MNIPTEVLRSVSLVAPLLLVACQGGNGDSGECPESPGTPVAVVGLTGATSLVIDGSASDTGLALYRTPTAADGAIPADDYLLAVRTDTVLAEPRRAASGSLADWFVGSAHASCAPDEPVASQRLVDLDLTSDASLAGVPAGSSLKAVATIHVLPSRFSLLGDGPVRSSRVALDDPAPSLEAFVSEEPRAPLAFDLRLDADADTTAEHRFTVTYSLEGGDVFTVTTDPVTLAPATSESGGGS